MHKYSLHNYAFKIMSCLVKIQDKNKPYFVEYIWTLFTEDDKMNEAKNNEHK